MYLIHSQQVICLILNMKYIDNDYKKMYTSCRTSTFLHIFIVGLLRLTLLSELYLPGPQTYIHAQTHFHEKRGILSIWSTNKWNREKGVIFQATVHQIKKKIEFICMFSSRFSLAQSIEPVIRCNEKYDVHRKFDTIILPFTRKMPCLI